MFILVYIPSRLLEQFSESQAGFRTTFKATDGFQKSCNKLSEEAYWKEFHN